MLRRSVLVVGIVLLYLSPYTGVRAASNAWSTSNFSVGGGHIIESSPILADIDGDGQQEIIVGTTAEQCTAARCSSTAHMKLVVMNPDGSVQWSVDTGAPIRSSPGVGDIDGDGDMEVVVTVGGDVYNVDHQGGAIAYDHEGNQLWRYVTQDHFPQDGYADGVFSSATLCDVDGDGNLEIAFGAWDQRVYLLDHTGQLLWQNIPNGWPGPGYYNADTIWSTAACADLDRDRFQEIIIGADITGGGFLPDGTATQNGGFLYIFDKDGHVLVRRHLPEALYSSPAVGDLDGDGDLEIVVGTSWYWWNVHGRTEQPYVYAFDTSQVFGGLPYWDPAKLPHLPGWPQPTDYPGFSSPALADLDRDWDLEIVIGTGHPDLENDGIAGAGSVYAWHHTGGLVTGWPIYPKNEYGDDAPVRSSPTIADVDNDGVLEILFSMLWDVQIYNADGSFQELLQTTWTVWASPAIGDTDGNGKVEVWIGGGNHYDQSQGYLWRFENGSSGVGLRPWPLFHRDAQHTGYFPRPPKIEASVESLYSLHDYGDQSAPASHFQLRNSGDVPFDWEVITKPSSSEVIPASGMLAPNSTVLVSVTLDATGYTTGTYSLGEIRISALSGEQPVEGSPLRIPVTLYVGKVHRVFLPFIEGRS